MCEATAFVATDGREKKIMENVILLQPEDDRLLLADLLGEQKLVQARVRSIDFLKHRIVLEEMEGKSPTGA
ncbi:MAG: CooT family nickel-binding protein [Chloroflexi bacterium]|nr:CooT family nickel-binding protein [Chloroflexota bacterium]